ncbi:predicted protein [Plenodomus lingam JN3]|uniref:Predicted protein n=1 Tax=Leptosphaeria maculans (strain JN3 / isolate v23.1.3 / race Av1-4-5-6-7-8) TaxID=985895 RepID=E5R432_LEPMJ|nr:predicted protein [Plenodomus lingam JN3]CBX91809.1 predicted protein [Plenodomus lingam JN3]
MGWVGMGWDGSECELELVLVLEYMAVRYRYWHRHRHMRSTGRRNRSTASAVSVLAPCVHATASKSEHDMDGTGLPVCFAGLGRVREIVMAWWVGVVSTLVHRYLFTHAYGLGGRASPYGRYRTVHQTKTPGAKDPLLDDFDSPPVLQKVVLHYWLALVHPAKCNAVEEHGRGDWAYTGLTRSIVPSSLVDIISTFTIYTYVHTNPTGQAEGKKKEKRHPGHEFSSTMGKRARWRYSTRM